MKEVAKEVATRCSHILFHLGVKLEGLIPFLNGWSGGVIDLVANRTSAVHLGSKAKLGATLRVLPERCPQKDVTLRVWEMRPYRRTERPARVTLDTSWQCT